MNTYSKAEKIHIVQTLDGKKLLDAYCLYRDKFNPLDHDWVETFDIIKEEILYRLDNGRRKGE